MDEPGKKSVKVGVVVGGGESPGYLWNVDILDVGFKDAMAFLDGEQYEHMAEQFRDLARSNEPTQSDTVDVRSIENFYEVRDKGGILGNLNVRVFFSVVHATRTIVVLGAINKKNDGSTPIGDKTQMRRRLRLYVEGQVK